MTIRYVWENMIINVPKSCGDIPHTEKRLATVRYDYDLVVNVRDIVDYLMPMSEKDKGTANFYMSKAIHFLLDNDSVDFEKLEEDSYFVEFMRERYENRALEEWREYNAEY